MLSAIYGTGDLYKQRKGLRGQNGLGLIDALLHYIGDGAGRGVTLV